MDDTFERYARYREWNKTHDCYKILYAPDGRDEHGKRIEYGNKSIQKKYNELSKPAMTYSEKLQDELEPITPHPAMGRKENKEQTLEDQKQELEDSLVQSLHQEKIRIEMDKIRAEGKMKEENVSDTHKIIYEAERRVKDGC